MHDDWPDTVLGDLVRIRSGVSPTNAALTEHGIHPFVKVDDLNLSSKYLAEARQFTENEKLCVPAGSILFAKRGAAIMVNKVRVAARQLALDTNMMALTPVRGRIDGEFLYYFILHQELAKIADVSSIPQINNKHINPYPISLPPLPEQREIAEILRNWDEALEKYVALKEAKERQYRWLQQRLLDHKPARRKWVSVELGTIICQRSEHSSQHDEYPVLTSSRRGLFLQSQYFSKQVTSADNTGYKIMRHGDFTFRSMSDDGRFVFNRLQEHEVGIISPAYGVFFAEGVSPKFLVHFLNSAYFSQLLSRETQGGTRKALRFSALAQMEVDLPNGEDQERIAEILDEARREIDLLEAQITTVQAQKRGLMQKLLTGEWRVKLEAPVA